MDFSADVRVGFIGFGNMAQAMARGFLRRQALSPAQMYACAKDWEKLCRNAQGLGLHPCRDAREVAKQADIVVVAVKPYLVREVLEPIKEELREKIVVSVAAGCLFEQYEDFLAPGTSHISTLPNTPVSVGEGVIVCERKHSLTEQEYERFKHIFGALGPVETVDTKQMGAAGVISGCGPAFAAMFIEALADGAVLHGLPRELAYKLASQMTAGTGAMQRATGEHPGAMKDAVCSPGGTTIVGVAALEKEGFRSAVIQAVDRIMNRDK